MCLPYAGAGAGVYRHWQQSSPAGLTIVPIQLPGREEEFTRPFYRSVPEAADGIAERIRQAAGAGPFIVFGHSLGSLLAYEATRRLLETGGPVPHHLVVSGSVSPRRRRAPWPATGSDAMTVARLREFTGQPLEALDHPELRELLLPALRADIALLTGYAPADRPPLPVPLTALRGSEDATVPVADWQDWQACTSAEYRAVELPGGHMYLNESWPLVLRTVSDVL
ncbi:thioesterase II family protein [Streptomyces sclerotialus]|uniref:thioesterase II family protein n=1 Tax=Streptomyces sclerotialus TaxID=1957 RepID=UPI0004C9711B